MRRIEKAVSGTFLLQQLFNHLDAAIPYIIVPSLKASPSTASLLP